MPVYNTRLLGNINSNISFHISETYVTISNGMKSFKSNVVERSCAPKWNYQQNIPLPDQLLTDSKRQLIIKVWHRDESSTDYVIGFAAVDLGILLRDSFSQILGW